MKKIKMILTNSFKEDIRVLKEAKSLVENEYDVEVLCWDREHELIDKPIEIRDGIKIKRFYPFSKYGTGKKQIIPFIKFTFEVFKYLRNKEIDVVHAHDMDGLIVGKISTFFKKKKFIYDSHEFFAGYKTTNIDKKIYYLEKFFLNKNDIIIAVSNSVAEKMFDMYKPKTKVNVIRNIPIFKKIDQKNDLLREEFGIEEKKCILLYQGLLIERRRLDILICAIEQMSDKYVLVFIGKGSYKKTLENLVLEKKLENRIFFKDFMENQILLNYTNSADIGIFLIGNDSLSHYYCLPNKIFEFIQGEIPIVTSNFPDLKDLVVSNKLGLVTDPNDLQSIKDSIEYIEANKSDYINSLKNIKPSLSWENEEVRLLELYKNFID